MRTRDSTGRPSSRTSLPKTRVVEVSESGSLVHSRTNGLPMHNWYTINWGYWNDYPVHLHAPELNTPAAVRLASNKYQSLKVLATAGVRIVELVERNRASRLEQGFTGWVEAATQNNLVPRNYNHRHGSDIEACRLGLSQPDFFTQYIDSNTEYRIHVARFSVYRDQPDGGHVILSQRKVASPGNETVWPRTHLNGYTYRHYSPDRTSADIYTTAIKAVAALGLDFGAVDMIRSNIDSHYYVLEVNTAPGLSTDASLGAYTEAFHRWLR